MGSMYSVGRLQRRRLNWYILRNGTTVVATNHLLVAGVAGHPAMETALQCAPVKCRHTNAQAHLLFPVREHRELSSLTTLLRFTYKTSNKTTSAPEASSSCSAFIRWSDRGMMLHSSWFGWTKVGTVHAGFHCSFWFFFRKILFWLEKKKI